VIRSAGEVVPCPADARGWVLAATVLGSSMAFVDSTVVNVALPAIQNNFHANVVDVQWVVESYGLFLGALILVGGSLGDLFGRRIIFLSGVAVFALASAGCGLAGSITQLIIARSVQGIGAALLVPGSLAIISASFEEKNRGQAIGMWSGFTAITTALGPVLGGWLVEHASWRWVFFINLPLAAAVIVISLWRVPESRNSAAQHVDWLGAITATLGLGGLIFGLIESSSLGWKNALVIGTLGGGLACVAAFFLVERRSKAPMVPLAMFASHTFSGANLLTLFLYAAIGTFFFLFPLNLIQVQGYSPTASGAATLPLIVLMFLMSRWSGGLVARYGPRRPLIAGPLIAATGFLLFARHGVGGSYWINYFPAIVILGLGMAVTVAPLTTVVMNSVHGDRVGTASGINNAVARVAGVLAIAVIGILMVTAFSYRLNEQLSRLKIAPAVLREIQANEIRLADIPIPGELDQGKRAAIKDSVAQAFTSGFRLVMILCSALATLSAGVAWCSIRSNPKST
jgi:EmrB/QacA subfamily drug resistance transporter